jgi:hypothetical protein
VRRGLGLRLIGGHLGDGARALAKMAIDEVVDGDLFCPLRDDRPGRDGSET